MRLETIEGLPTLRVEDRPPLPVSLDELLRQLFSVSTWNPIRPGGAATQCETWRVHRFEVIAEGRHWGPDHVLRDLRVQMCADCGACCVRDISFDRRPGLPVGASGPVRRDRIIGWYTGKRRDARQHL